MDRGELLRCHPQVQEVIQEIDYISEKAQNLMKSSLEVDQKEMVPFIFLNGTSGMGKTQMAFTLMKSGYTVHYLFCTEKAAGSSNMLMRYSKISEQFLDCLDYDYKNNDGMGFCSKTCGFIVALITKSSYFYSMPIKTAREDIQKYFFGREMDFRKIVIFLDEFPHMSYYAGRRNSFHYLRWMRDVFRYLLLTVICSSSSTSAVHLITASYTYDYGGEVLEWCFVIPRLPGALKVENPAFSSFFIYLLNHSRPLFSNILEEILLKTPNMEESAILGAVGEKLHLLKYKFGDNFAHRQIALLFGAYHHRLSNDDGLDGSFNHSHFANLREEEPFKLLAQNDVLKLTTSYSRWSPCVKFPRAEEDILLFLCLMGNKNYWPIREMGKLTRIPLYKSSDSILQLAQRSAPTFLISFENPGNGWLRFEAFAIAAVVLASHYGGIGGIPFGLFMAELLFEVRCSHSLSEVTCLASGYDRFKTLLVPFLSVPGVTWPLELVKMDNNLINLTRTGYSEKVDFISQTFCVDTEMRVISGVCKNWKSTVTRDELSTILERVPKESIFHFVFVHKMQDIYFSKTKFIRTENIKSKLILKYDHDAHAFVSINGLDQPVCEPGDGIIMFIPLRHNA